MNHRLLSDRTTLLLNVRDSEVPFATDIERRVGLSAKRALAAQRSLRSDGYIDDWRRLTQKGDKLVWDTQNNPPLTELEETMLRRLGLSRRLFSDDLETSDTATKRQQILALGTLVRYRIAERETASEFVMYSLTNRGRGILYDFGFTIR